MTDLTDREAYILYKKLSPKALPEGNLDDPMDLAEQVELLGELGFLADPLPLGEAPPKGLMDRALALGPRPIKPMVSSRAALMMSWKQIMAAILTFAAFGSGSYALANGLTTTTTTSIDSTDPFTSDTAGLFEIADDSGFFFYE